MNKPVKSIFVSTLVAATLIATSVAATAAEPRTPTPQMMRGQWGGGYGPGMMGGGYGPGMIGGGYGPGMMGGGYGPGMMGGGLGPGYGMGMMGGWGVGMGPLYMLDLTDAQAAQMEKIQTEMMSKHRVLARQMWEEQEKLGDMYSSDKRDPDKIGKVYSNIADIQRKMIEMHTEAENKMEALLTKEQKAQLRRNYGRGMMGY
ncbi:MAG: Spy/CpxP family protein refolding chaperone [Gallionellaceae bacterium]